jgi:hydrogenase nickel incorporation protein HypA/HybF
MHESLLARQIAEMALARARAEGARAVLRVDGWVAETEALSPESLRLHFEAATRDTAAAGARLNLRVTHVEAECGACKNRYPPEHHVLVCPRCGEVGGRLLGKTGVGVEALEVE